MEQRGMLDKEEKNGIEEKCLDKEEKKVVQIKKRRME